MVKSMFAIGWLELGKAEKAQLLLHKCFQNIQAPFQVKSCLAPFNKEKSWLTDVGVFTPVPSGVERVGRRLRCRQLSHRNGRIPAGRALRLHRLQVSGRPGQAKLKDS